jgi:thiol peroxidase
MSVSVSSIASEKIGIKCLRLFTIHHIGNTKDASVDLPFAQKRFCSSHDTENGVVVSDYKDLDFGEKYGFVIDEFRLLARGVIVIDEENTVKYVEFVPEVTDHIDYDEAMKAVKSLL